MNDIEWSRWEISGTQTTFCFFCFLCGFFFNPVLTMLTPLASYNKQGHFHCHVWSELLIYVLSGRSISPVIVMLPLVISFPWGSEIAASSAASWGISPKCSLGNCSCKYSQSKPNKVSEDLYYPEGWELHTKIIFQDIMLKAFANSIPTILGNYSWALID